MTNEEWLQSLKPGDKVVVYRPYGERYIRAIKRTTKTMVLAGADEEKYRKKDGEKCAGDPLGREYIGPIDDEVRESVLRSRCECELRDLASYAKTKLPLSEVREILDWLKQRKESE